MQVAKVAHLLNVGPIIILPDIVNQDQEIMNVEVMVINCNQTNQINQIKIFD